MNLIGRKNQLSAYMLKANRMPQKWRSLLTLHQLVSTKQFWIEIRLDVSRKQGPTHIEPDLDPSCLILKVFLICFVIFLKKVTLKKIKRRHFWKVIQRGTCIKGLFWPPLEPKTESCFSPISSYWFIRRIAQVLNSGIYFIFTSCYGNQNGRQNRLKIEKLPF